MKKIYFFLSAIAIVSLASCSDSDNESSTNPSTDVLPKKIVWEQDDPDGFNYEITYTYNGNKLIQGTDNDGTIERYTYTGDLITKIEEIYDGVVEFQELFEYDSTGRLVLHKYQELLDDYQERNVLVYNTDGTVTQNSYNETLNSTATVPSVYTLSFENGEMTKIVQQGYSTYKYTYDGKNSPFKNVTGYAAVSYITHGDFETEGKNQNILSVVDQTHNQSYMANTIQYNANNYPTKVTSVAVFDSNYPNTTEELVMTYFYE